MFQFSGICQIVEILEHEKVLNNKIYKKIRVLSTRNEYPIYDGKSPFDVYDLTIEFNDKNSTKFLDLKVNDILYIKSGNIISWNKKFNQDYIWNSLLTISFNDVVIIGASDLVLDYKDHLKEFKNSQRFK